MEHLTLHEGCRVKLDDWDPDDTGKDFDKNSALTELDTLHQQMADLQEVFYASGKYALLIVLQAMDAGGKDGTVSHVMRGLNPAGCAVTPFKVPSAEELSHDFLWRIHKAVPARGQIGIFNRSHYEDVLVVRVMQLAPEKIWRARFEQINSFEKNLAQNNVIILKFFLHISHTEQTERLRARLEDPTKNWKITPSDLEMRTKWSDYQKAYEEVLECCTTEYAPWTIVPANKKWYRNLVVAAKIVKTLKSLDLHFPPPAPGLEKIRIE